jgi:uncharacterized protein YdaT
MNAVITIDMGEVLTGLAALVTAIGVVAPSFLAWRAARRAEEQSKLANATSKVTSEVVKESATKISEVSAKADALHIQGNSNLARMNKMSEEIGNQKGRNEERAEREAEEGKNPL